MKDDAPRDEMSLVETLAAGSPTRFAIRSTRSRSTSASSSRSFRARCPTASTTCSSCSRRSPPRSSLDDFVSEFLRFARPEVEGRMPVGGASPVRDLAAFSPPSARRRGWRFRWPWGGAGDRPGRRLPAQAGGAEPRAERSPGDAAGGHGVTGRGERGRGRGGRRRRGHARPRGTRRSRRSSRPVRKARAWSCPWCCASSSSTGVGGMSSRPGEGTAIPVFPRTVRGRGRRSILLVEDHAESRASLAYVLEKRGEAVHQAANGRAASRSPAARRLHAMILDLKLPDMEGLSVLRRCAWESPGFPRSSSPASEPSTPRWRR